MCAAESALHGQFAEPTRPRAVGTEGGGEADEPLQIVLAQLKRELGAEAVAGDGIELQSE